MADFSSNTFKHSSAIALGALILTLATQHATAQLRIDTLRCDNLEQPLSIDTQHPRLSWLLHSDQRGEQQAAYQLLVASTPDLLAHNTGDLCDTGRTTSDQSTQLPYAGKPLTTQMQCWWKVRVWNKVGGSSDWSTPAQWSMGFLDPADWKAQWITPPVPDGATPSTALPLFRRAFQLPDKPIRRAILSLSGLGQFEIHLNGEKVGDDILQPGWTDYRKTCLYVDYDITSRLKSGSNALGVMLGNGMYTIPATKGRYAKFKGTFGLPKLIAQLKIDYTDGSSDTILSDGDWKTTPGPITFSSIYGGEDFDARLEPAGWDREGFNDAAWTPATPTEGPGGALRGESQSAPPVRIAQIFDTQNITQPKPGIFVFDMGQNCAMMPLLTVRGDAGASVRITPGEFLNADGTVNQSNSGGPSYFNYTLKGDGDERWSPRFSYYGARYLQVTGAVPADQPNPTNLPVIQKLQSQFITSTSASAGEFSCSNDLFNRTADIIRWAMRNNMLSLLTDCPHRERLGWLEQDHLVGPSLMYNFDVQNLFTKICGDIRDAQTPAGLVPDIAPEFTKFSAGFRDSPEWGSAALLIPWQVYQWYGNTEILRQNYDSMKRYVDYLGTKATEHILNHGLGDWYDLGPKPAGRAQLTPINLTATAFYYRDLSTLQKTAELLGHPDDAQHYAVLAADVRIAFNRKLYRAAEHTYATGSQTSNAIPLVFGLAPEQDRHAIIDNLVADIRKRDNGLTSGDIGFRYLLRALADAGRSDVIFDMNSRADRPGYGMILAQGNTSLTESWSGTNSRDHFMLGHIMEWFYSDLAGIQCDPATPGFRNILIRPTPVGDVTWAKASVDCPYGKIAVSWKKEGGKFTLDATVPTGASASIRLVTDAAGPVLLDGMDAANTAGVKCVQREKAAAVYAVQSGTYHFETPTR